MASHSLDVLTALDSAVPSSLADLASAWTPASTPAVPRLAASVVLCRDSRNGVETYLLHRHARMAFAASMVVFPGGGVDAVDGLAARPVGQQPDQVAAAGTSDRRSSDAMLLACAVRETREETGVVLHPTELVPWAHWITPVMQPIRYDTHFFFAVLPSDQTAGDLSTETERAAWATPAEAIAAYEDGTLAMMPPTLSILIELAGLCTVAEAREHGRNRVIETVQPDVVPGGSGWVYRYPAPARRT